MAMNGPSVSRKKCCKYACMGPLSLQKYPADSYERAQCSYQQMLPIPLDTPIIAAEKCCQCLRMGPVFLGLPIPLDGPIIAAERYCRWSQMSQCFLTKTCYRCQRMGPLSCENNLPMARKGPSVSFKKCCQYACMGSLSSLNGPIVAFTKYYRSSQIGPAFPRRNDADALGWAYYCC